MRRRRFRHLFGILAIPAPAAGAPEARACRLALSLAIDVSGSIDSADYRLELGGLAAAFRDERVRAAILDGGGPVAVSVYEWSGESHRAIILNWSLLRGAADIDRLAAAIARHRRTVHGQKTAIGLALGFGRDLLDRAPDCERHVIDVSGDGYNNLGPVPRQVYAVTDFSRITVNALVIGGLARPVLTRYFEEQVIHGADAFAMATQDLSDYPRAIRRKLLRELGAPGAIAQR